MHQFRSIAILLFAFSAASPAMGLVQSLSRFSNTLTQLSNSLQRQSFRPAQPGINHPAIRPQNNPQNLPDQQILETQRRLQQQQQEQARTLREQQQQQKTLEQQEQARRAAEKQETLKRQQQEQQAAQQREDQARKTAQQSQGTPVQAQNSITIYGVASNASSNFESCPDLKPTTNKIALLTIKTSQNEQEIIQKLTARLRNYKIGETSYFQTIFQKIKNDSGKLNGLPITYQDSIPVLQWQQNKSGPENIFENIVTINNITTTNAPQPIATANLDCKTNQIHLQFKKLYANNTLIWSSDTFVHGAQKLTIYASIDTSYRMNNTHSENKNVGFGQIIKVFVNAKNENDLKTNKQQLTNILNTSNITLTYDITASEADGDWALIDVVPNKNSLKAAIESITQIIKNSFKNNLLLTAADKNAFDSHQIDNIIIENNKSQTLTNINSTNKNLSRNLKFEVFETF